MQQDTNPAMSGFPHAMKRHHPNHRPVALAALIATTALTFNPAFAQEAVSPPVVQTAPPPAVEPAPAPAPAATSAPVFAPRQEVAQPTPPRPVVTPEATAPEPAAAPVRTSRAPAAKPRAVTPVQRSMPARSVPVAATPVAPTPIAPPPAEATLPAPAPATEPVAAVPEADAPVVADTAPAASERGTMMWLWGALGLGAVALLIGMLVSRRRRDAYALDYGEPSYVAVDESGAPVPEVNLNERPWIRLMLQPTGTASHGDRKTVDYQVIVENEGHVPAHDVRISSFPAGTKASDIVSGLANVNAQTHQLDIAPGGSVPVNGTVTVPEGTDPRLVIDARYPLPDGREGHLAARFGIDVSTSDLEVRVEDVLERV